METGVVAVVGALVGIILGFTGGITYQRKQSASVLGSAAQQARNLIEEGRREAETARREAAVEARDQALELRQSAEALMRARVDSEWRTRKSLGCI